MAQQRFSNPPIPPVHATVPGPNAATANTPLVALSNPGDSWVWNFGNTVAYNQAAKKSPRKPATDAWMASESRWKNRIGKGWVGKRLLGRGTYGIVGHWTYEGPDRDAKSVKDVAVKQSLRFAFPLGGFGLEFEATNLLQLGRARSQHIVQMYRHLYEEVGQRTNEFDLGLIHRIFLEYCPGGDMANWMREHLMNNTAVPENELWAIFHCLARACLVMHHGSENAAVPNSSWPPQQLVHFDLKLENVLIGAATTDVEHRNMPPFKFADLGMGRRVGGVQTPQYLKDYAEFGTPEYFAPEQVITKDHLCGPRPWFDFVGNCTVVGVRYGTATNIWQVGLIMHCLISRSRYPIWDKNSIDRLRCYKSILSTRLRGGGDTIGNSTDQACEYNSNMSAYSVELRTLLHECLIVNPLRRPMPAEVVQRTQNAIDSARMTMGGVLNQTFRPYSEPALSARWYSGQINRTPADRPPQLTPPQATDTDKVHDTRIALEELNLKQGISPAQMPTTLPPTPNPQNPPVAPLAQFVTTTPPPAPPPPITNPPVVPSMPTPPPPSAPNPPAVSTVPSPPPAPNPRLARQPAVKPPVIQPSANTPAVTTHLTPARVLHNITQVICIVQTKSFFGNPIFKTYTVQNLTGDILVIDAKDVLMGMGCEIHRDKQIWMNGRVLMGDFMKLKEFGNLVGGRNIVRVTSR